MWTERILNPDIVAKSIRIACPAGVYTGREIWKPRLPVGIQAGPMTYVSPHSGKQYTVITAGGARVSPDRGDYVIACALLD